MEKLKKGDFVRYLGGDEIFGADLTVGKVYEVIRVDFDGDVVIIDESGLDTFIHGNNAECYVKVFDELSEVKETTGSTVISDYEKKAYTFEDGSGSGSALSSLYPKYYKDVSGIESIDVYMTHELFGIDDPSGAIQHASKKLLLSGVRTGGKSKYSDIKEARDTLNRWLEIYEEESD